MNGKTELLPCPFCGGEAEKWIAANRCPWCRNRIWCKRDYKVEKAYVGWKCSGYRCDEERRFTA